jgi:hypothetical protein
VEFKHADHSLSKRIVRTASKMVQMLMMFITITWYSPSYADSLPHLIWTAAPTIYTDSGGGGVNPTDTGMTVIVSCEVSAPGCAILFTADRKFAVTSPGDFRLVTSVENDISVLNCDPETCHVSSFAGWSFNGDSSISGTSVSSFSGSGFRSSPNTEAIVTLNNAYSALITLARGDYTLEDDYFAEAGGSGDAAIHTTFNSSLVPTPEPQSYSVFVSVVFVILFFRRRGIGLRC